MAQNTTTGPSGPTTTGPSGPTTKGNPNEIGALWSKTSSAGAPYMTGYVTVDGKRIELVLFTNKNKTQDNHPDWRINLSVPKGQAPVNPAPSAKAPAKKAVAPAKVAAPVSNEFEVPE